MVAEPGRVVSGQAQIRDVYEKVHGREGSTRDHAQAVLGRGGRRRPAL
jgi:hypothetical protein